MIEVEYPRKTYSLQQNESVEHSKQKKKKKKKRPKDALIVNF